MGNLPVEVDAFHSLRAYRGSVEEHNNRLLNRARAKSCRLTSNRILASSDQNHPRASIGEGEFRERLTVREARNKHPFHLLMRDRENHGIDFG